MIRKRIVAELCMKVWPKFAAIYNKLKAEDRTPEKVIREYCRIENIPVFQYTKDDQVGGLARNGERIYLRKTPDMPLMEYYVFFHELCHHHLHFTQSGKKLSLPKQELEAEAFAVMLTKPLCSSSDAHEAIIKLANDNPAFRGKYQCYETNKPAPPSSYYQKKSKSSQLKLKY